MVFEIKDLTGLSKPLTRLIDVCSQGIGKAFEAPAIVLKAYAKRKEIGLIADAIKGHGTGNELEFTYKDGAVEIISRPTPPAPSPSISETMPTLVDRANQRLQFQTQREQARLEKIALYAAADLRDETSVPENKPHEDWIARFFSQAQQISSEEMQQIWGKILAGEIKRPGKFSLRTLDAVRNISQQEAELFVQVAQYAFCVHSDVCVPEDIGKCSANKLVDRHLVELAEAGLLRESPILISPFEDGNTRLVLLFSNEIAVSVTKDPNMNRRIEPILGVLTFTNTAKQLAEFFDWENPPGYVEAICEKAKKLGWIPTIGTYTNLAAPEFHENPGEKDNPQ